jgi:hypothetical protein
MKHVKKAIALSGLLVLLTFSAALGQSDRQTIIYIPFNFTAGEKQFPAGKYAFERIWKSTDSVWMIRRNDNVSKAMLLTRPVRANEAQQQTRLVFHQYGDLYFLSEIWTVGDATGRAIQTSHREKSLDKGIAEQRQDRILIDRGR